MSEKLQRGGILSFDEGSINCNRLSRYKLKGIVCYRIYELIFTSEKVVRLVCK